MPGMNFLTKADYLDAPTSRARRWLLDAVDMSQWSTDDREIVTSLYKAPLALRLLGASRQFCTVTQFIQTHLVVGGRLLEPDPSQEYLSYCPQYRNCWTALGAPTLITAFPPPPSASSDCDLLSLSCLGLVARATLQHSLFLSFAQLVIPYITASSQGHILLRPPADSRHELSEGAMRWFVVSSGTRDPKTYIPALAIIALVEACRISNDMMYMEAARTLWDYLERLGDALYSGDYVGKIGLANAQLFRTTRDKKFRTRALRAAEHLLSWQNDDGSVLLPHRFSDRHEQPWSMTFDRTSEFLIALLGIRALLT
jgi:hypothetical protein